MACCGALGWGEEMEGKRSKWKGEKNLQAKREKREGQTAKRDIAKKKKNENAMSGLQAT